MATPKKAAEPELPLEPIEPKPTSVDDIEFEVLIYPAVQSGGVVWLWQVEDHTAKPYIGDYTSLKSARGFESVADAEFDAKRHVDRVRNVVGISLTMPEPRRVTL